MEHPVFLRILYEKDTLPIALRVSVVLWAHCRRCNSGLIVVSAGEDLTIDWPDEEAVLHGMVTDDGFPAGGILSQIWSKSDGPGEVTFTDAEEAETTAWFSEPGMYVLRLTATDGELTSWAGLA